MTPLKKKVDYISASQLNTFLTCPVAYYKIYFEGAEKMPPNIYMIYGTAIHEALAENFKHKMVHSEDLIVNKVIKIFSDKFREEIATHSMVSSDEFELLGAHTLHHYMKHVAPEIKPLLVEKRFEIQLDKFPVKIMGFIDLVDDKGNGIIIDHKTAGMSWKKTWNQRVVDKSVQLTIYSIAYRKLFKKVESGVAIDVLPRDAKCPYTRIQSARSQDQVIHTLELLTNVQKISDLGVFIPNYNSCSQCPFASTCARQPIMNMG